MAIAYSTSTANWGNTTTTSWTKAHDNGSGSNRLTIVAFMANTTDTITGVTYAGSAMAQVNTIILPGNRYTYVYSLVGGPTGSNNVVINSSASTFMEGLAVSYTGVDQGSNSPEANGANSGTGTSLSVNVTVSTNNAWLIGGSFDDTGYSKTAGSNTFVRAQESASRQAVIDTNADQTTGSKSMTVTMGTSTKWTMIAGSFKPFVAGGAVVNHRMGLMGIGQ